MGPGWSVGGGETGSKQDGSIGLKGLDVAMKSGEEEQGQEAEKVLGAEGEVRKGCWR